MTRTQDQDNDAETRLGTEEAKALVLDEVKEICPTGSVAFSGGEFLLRPDALELLEHNARNGLYSFVNTNGTLLTPALLREMKRATGGRITFGFSLDSVDPRTQDGCRNGDNELLERLTRMCDEERTGYFVLVTISRKNLHTLRETVEFLKSRRIPMVRSPFIPRGAAGKSRDLQFGKGDMERTIHAILRENPLCYVSHTPFFAAPDAMRLGLGRMSVSLGNLGCQAGRTFVGISAEGDVAPCVHLLDTTVNCGNVRQQPLSEMLRTNPILLSLRGESQVKGKCSRCRYKNSCRGCRALAYYATGDYLAEDPTCFFEPVDENTRSDFEEIQTRNARGFIEFVAANRPWNGIFQPSSLGERVGLSLLKSAAKLRKAFRGMAPEARDDEDTAD
jgi:radical SAM protein with 4Fe4S-binding SPASM domain